MPLSRRQFVARTAAATAALPLASPTSRFLSPLPSAASRPGPAEFTPIRRNVGYFTDRGGTIGYLRSPEALVAVDTQFPESARAFLEGLREGSDRGLDLLVNTHHHGDHTAGNAVLAPVAARHVAHEAVPGLQRAAASRGGGLEAQEYADETFRETWRGEVGDETVALHYFGPAHTCGDAVVQFEAADVVHMGDLMFNHRQPYIDRGAGASVRGWMGVLEAVHGRFSDGTAFVFGHAGDGYPVQGTRADLLVMRDFLDALYAAVAGWRNEGLDAEAMVAREVPGHADWGPTPMRVIEPVLAEIEATE